MTDPAERFRRYSTVVRMNVRNLPYGKQAEKFLRGVYLIFTTPITLHSFNGLKKRKELENLVEEARKNLFNLESNETE